MVLDVVRAGPRGAGGGAGHGAARAAGGRAAAAAHAVAARAGRAGRRHARAVLRWHLGRAIQPVRDRGGVAVRAHAGGPRPRRAGGAAGRGRAGGLRPARAEAPPRTARRAHVAARRGGPRGGAGGRGGVRRGARARQRGAVARAPGVALVAPAHRRHGGRAGRRRGPALRRRHEPRSQLRPRAASQPLGRPLGVLGGPAGRRGAGHSAAPRGVGPAARGAPAPVGASLARHSHRTILRPRPEAALARDCRTPTGSYERRSIGQYHEGAKSLRQELKISNECSPFSYNLIGFYHKIES